MTTNIGHKEKAKRGMGFLPQEEESSNVYKSSLKKYLRPELLARVDEILFFNGDTLFFEDVDHAGKRRFEWLCKLCSHQ